MPPAGQGRPPRSPADRAAAPLFTEQSAQAPADSDTGADDADIVVPKLPVQTTRRSFGAPAAFVGVAVLTAAAHAVAATFAASWVATLAEARFAVAVLAVRDATITPVSLAPWDRLAAIQIAAVQLLMPAADPVDATRWACLALGMLATLLLWPVLRSLTGSVAAAAVGVGTVGVAVPVLVLHSAITTAPVAAVWLALAAALAVRDRIRAAGVAALLAVITVPLAAAPLLALAAVVSFDGTLRLSGRLRTPVGILAALAALVVVLAVVLPGAPFAAAAGPAVPTGYAVAGAVVVVLLAALAGLADRLLRPVLAAAAPLVIVGLVPGPSRAAAGVLVVPVVAIALGVVTEQFAARVPHRLPKLAAVGVLVALLAVPLGVAVGTPVPPRTPLTAWVLSQPNPGTVVVADVLDRALLQAAGFPPNRLRSPSEPAVPGELRLVSNRPDATAPPCPTQAELAETPRGSGGAAAVVCGAFTPATAAEGRARARLGAALSQNPSLAIDPAAVVTLRDGMVDPRLMLTLAALTAAHKVGVAAFPTVQLDASGALRRVVEVSTFDGSPAASSQLLRTWLTAQQAPFAPASITVRGTALVIGYPVPSPTGLLPL